MKKALLSFASMLTAALPAMSIGIEATINGNPVGDGDTFSLSCETKRYDYGDFYSWDPDLQIRSKNGTANIELTVYTYDESFTVCWPSVCRLVLPGEAFFASGDVGESWTSMQMHREIILAAGSTPPEGSASAEVKIYDEDGESIAFTIICDDPSAEVETTMQTSSTPTAAYGIYGATVAPGAKGLVIVRNQDGTYRKEIR